MGLLAVCSQIVYKMKHMRKKGFIMYTKPCLLLIPKRDSSGFMWKIFYFPTTTQSQNKRSVQHERYA